MASSCLVSLLCFLLLSFLVTPPFFLQTCWHLPVTLLLLQTIKKYSGANTSSRLATSAHIVPPTLPPHPTACWPCSVLPSSDPTLSLKCNPVVSFFVLIGLICGVYICPCWELREEWWTYTSLLTWQCVISTMHPHPPVSDGRIPPGPGPSLTVISLWCSNVWGRGFQLHSINALIHCMLGICIAQCFYCCH